MLKLLLASGADVHLSVPAPSITPLFAAAVRGDIKVVELLVESGADSQHALLEAAQTAAGEKYWHAWAFLVRSIHSRYGDAVEQCLQGVSTAAAVKALAGGWQGEVDRHDEVLGAARREREEGQEARGQAQQLLIQTALLRKQVERSRPARWELNHPPTAAPGAAAGAIAAGAGEAHGRKRVRPGSLQDEELLSVVGKKQHLSPHNHQQQQPQHGALKQKEHREQGKQGVHNEQKQVTAAAAAPAELKDSSEEGGEVGAEEEGEVEEEGEEVYGKQEEEQKPAVETSLVQKEPFFFALARAHELQL